MATPTTRAAAPAARALEQSEQQTVRPGDSVMIRAHLIRYRLDRAEVQIQGGEFMAVPLDAMISAPEATP